MEQWLRTTFPVLSANPAQWRNYDAFQFRITDIDGHDRLVETPIAWFVERFGTVPVPPTATSLKAADSKNLMGWHQHFDEWVRQGIIQP